MDGKKLGLVLGSFAALVHFVWVILIALNWAQPLMGFTYSMHFLNNPFMVMPFDFARSVELVVLTFIIGNIAGNIFAGLWNEFNK